MEYKLRNLVADDLFVMMTIINKIGIDDVKKCIESVGDAMQGKEMDERGVGIRVMMDVAGLLMARLPACREEIYLFIMSLMEGDECMDIAKMPIAEFAELLMQVIKKKDFADFFTAVVRSIKPET